MLNPSILIISSSVFNSFHWSNHDVLRLAPHLKSCNYARLIMSHSIPHLRNAFNTHLSKQIISISQQNFFHMFDFFSSHRHSIFFSSPSGLPNWQILTTWWGWQRKTKTGLPEVKWFNAFLWRLNFKVKADQTGHWPTLIHSTWARDRWAPLTISRMMC